MRVSVETALDETMETGLQSPEVSYQLSYDAVRTLILGGGSWPVNRRLNERSSKYSSLANSAWS